MDSDALSHLPMSAVIMVPLDLVKLNVPARQIQLLQTYFDDDSAGDGSDYYAVAIAVFA